MKYLLLSFLATQAVAASLRGAHILTPRHLETVEETLISEVILSSNDGLELTRTADILQGTTQLVCQLEDLQAEVEGSTQLVVTVENTEGTGFITCRESDNSCTFDDLNRAVYTKLTVVVEYTDTFSAKLQCDTTIDNSISREWDVTQDESDTDRSTGENSGQSEWSLVNSRVAAVFVDHFFS